MHGVRNLTKNEQSIPALIHAESGDAPHPLLFFPNVLLPATHHSDTLNECLILVLQPLILLAFQVDDLDFWNRRIDSIEGQNSVVSGIQSWIVDMTEILHVVDIGDFVCLKHFSVRC